MGGGLWEAPWECHLNNENEAREINAMPIKFNERMRRTLIRAANGWLACGASL